MHCHTLWVSMQDDMHNQIWSRQNRKSQWRRNDVKRTIGSFFHHFDVIAIFHSARGYLTSSQVYIQTLNELSHWLWEHLKIKTKQSEVLDRTMNTSNVHLIPSIQLPLVVNVSHRRVRVPRWHNFLLTHTTRLERKSFHQKSVCDENKCTVKRAVAPTTNKTPVGWPTHRLHMCRSETPNTERKRTENVCRGRGIPSL